MQWLRDKLRGYSDNDIKLIRKKVFKEARDLSKKPGRVMYLTRKEFKAFNHG